MQFLQALENTSVFYWLQPKVSFGEVSFLLVSNGLLLVLCRSASFGFGETIVDVIIIFIALLLQYLAAIASLIRGGKGGIKNEAPKLAKAMAVVWLVSLVLFLPNSIPALRWFGIINSSWVISFLHSAFAVALVAYYSLHPLKASDFGGYEMTMGKYSLYKWTSFLVLVNTILFNLFVLDDGTHFWILDNYNDLKDLVVSKVGAVSQ